MSRPPWQNAMLARSFGSRRNHRVQMWLVMAEGCMWLVMVEHILMYFRLACCSLCHVRCRQAHLLGRLPWQTAMLADSCGHHLKPNSTDASCYGRMMCPHRRSQRGDLAVRVEVHKQNQQWPNSVHPKRLVCLNLPKLLRRWGFYCLCAYIACLHGGGVSPHSYIVTSTMWSLVALVYSYFNQRRHQNWWRHQFWRPPRRRRRQSRWNLPPLPS